LSPQPPAQDVTQEVAFEQSLLVEKEAEQALQDVVKGDTVALPDAQAVLRELCMVAGEDYDNGQAWNEERVADLLARLQRDNPDSLRSVLKKSARLEDQIILSELKLLEGRVSKLEAEVRAAILLC
jgi:hypothetical protein